MGIKDIVKKLKKEDEFKQVEPTEEAVKEENPMEDLADEVKTEKKEKVRYVVVKELPMQQVRSAKAQDGVTEIYITIEEALADMLNIEEKQ